MAGLFEPEPPPASVFGTGAEPQPAGLFDSLAAAYRSNGPMAFVPPELRAKLAAIPGAAQWFMQNMAPGSSDVSSLMDYSKDAVSAGRNAMAGNWGQAGASGISALTNLLAAAPMVPAAGAIKALTGAGTDTVRAYHGSPHSFDKFDSSRIGTGEGAQAYGHGLYFAEKEGVAKSYRDQLSASGPRATEETAKQYNMTVPQADYAIRRWEDYLKNANQSDRDGMIAYLKKKGDGPSIGTRDNQIALDILEGRLKSSAGHMYEVNIRAKPEDFLQWDKPLSEQPQGVREALDRTGYLKDAAKYFEVNKKTNPTFGDLYDFLGYAGHQAPQISSSLREAGVAGIRYADAGSRGAQAGTHNYVAFDDNIIEIIRKYGIAGLMAGGVGAAVLNSGDAQAGQ